MSFKKDGADPVTTRPINLKYVGLIWQLLGIVKPMPPERDPYAYIRSKRPKQRPTRRTNMLHVSKRARRKHRRARNGA